MQLKLAILTEPSLQDPVSGDLITTPQKRGVGGRLDIEVRMIKSMSRAPLLSFEHSLKLEN